MNTSKLRSKRILIPTAVAVLALGAGGAAWASTASATDDLQGSERDRVAAAAIEAVGEGKVVDVESSDDPGEAYEVEVRKSDDTEVDVTLDKDLSVIGQDAEKREDDGTAADADDRPLSAAERTSAEKAALAAVGSGTVTDVEASDDGPEAYEVDVRGADGTEWDIELDADFKVLEKKTER